MIFGKKKILIIAHSFGGFSTYHAGTQEISSENDKYVDDAPLDVEVARHHL
jgi:hypothetical protein